MKRTYIVTSVLLTGLFVWLSIDVFGNSYLRFFETMNDLWSSLQYYVCRILGLKHNIIPTVDNYSNVLEWGILLPADWDMFVANVVDYCNLFVDKDNFVTYMNTLLGVVSDIAKGIAILLPCFVVIWFAIKRLYNRPNNDHNMDTVPLVLYKKMCNVTYYPVKRWVKGYIVFLNTYRHLPTFWVVLWIFSLNLASIVVGFLAFYFYFAVSYKFESFYIQFCKLLIDLQVVLDAVPLWIIAIVCLWVLDRLRRKIAVAKLWRFEGKNCGFINELPIVSMTCGSMGKKKTTIITDMTLSQEMMFRQKAFELLQKNDMKFPNFPWIMFEMELRKCMEYGRVYNLASIKDWVKLKRNRFEKHGNEYWQLYGYDYRRYGYLYDDTLKTQDLFDVLETYAQLYFIYVIESSLIVSNYAIRTDNVLLDNGNFPKWIFDFFPEKRTNNSRYAHILDFDVLRLGKKVIDNNPKTGSFEFGVVVISEVGKERGNNLELKDVKKKTNDANQKNDLFNSWLKMCRHSATVDNYPFIKVFTDEQRPESWGADARDLCDIVHIVSSGQQKLALPFYTIEEMIYEWSYARFLRLYYIFRFRRGDNTLLVYLLKNLVGLLYRHNVAMYNKYGYCVSHIEKERGTLDGTVVKKKYYLINSKIYSMRFSTDCFSDYFNEMARRTNIGLMDYIEYACEKATVEELKKQNSYFIRDLYDTGSD